MVMIAPFAVSSHLDVRRLIASVSTYEVSKLSISPVAREKTLS